ncbi:MAG TPA: gamma-glutamyltransferase [Solirubrobacteraceae bacterium]
MSGVVAAGHPESAEAGARVLRAGGNAVDAALGAMLASFVHEPLLTGFGAGGYMLVCAPGAEPVLLDFFVAASGRGGAERRADLLAVDVSFGDAEQVFNVGAASVGTYGTAAGMDHAARRWGTVPLADLAGPAAEAARAGVPVAEQQAYITEILGQALRSTPECAALFAPEGRLLRAGETWRSAEVGDALERFGAEGAVPFYTGDLAAAASDHVIERGGTLTREDLAAYEAIERAPVRVGYRDRAVMTNPPPSAGGILIATALHDLAVEPGPPDVRAVVRAMVHAQSERTPEFVAGLDDPGFAARFAASRLGSTTHISVVDGTGMACGVTCSNGVGSGIVVPGTGLHLNNMMGEEDLNPLGFFGYEPGRRMPSMTAPTAVLRDGAVELVVGSAGSNRIRSAILQVIIGVVDHGRAAGPAVQAPRVHFEDDVVFAEPGVDVDALRAAGWTVQPFRALNLFFGGAQAVQRDLESGALTGGGDPRGGGAVVSA